MRTVYLGNVTNCPIQFTYWELLFWSRDWQASFVTGRVSRSKPLTYLDGILVGIYYWVAGTGNEGASAALGGLDLADNREYVLSGDYLNLTATVRVPVEPTYLGKTYAQWLSDYQAGLVTYYWYLVAYAVLVLGYTEAEAKAYAAAITPPTPPPTPPSGISGKLLAGLAAAAAGLTGIILLGRKRKKTVRS